MAFHISNTKLHLTYKTHIDAQKWLNWANKNTKLPRIEQYSIVNEISDKVNPYEHTHILILFTEKFVSKKSTILDYEGIHPNIAKVTTNKHFTNCVKYHYKQSTPFTNISLDKQIRQEIEKIDFTKYEDYNFEVGVDFSITSDPKEFDVDEFRKPKPLTDEEKKKSILKQSNGWLNTDTYQCENISDALLKNNNPKMAGAIIASFKYKPLKPVEKEPKVYWRDWQLELYNELKGPSDDRSVIWYYDDDGGSGKSVLVEHMELYYKAFTIDYADTTNLPTALANWKQIGGNLDMILIDLSRTSQEDDEFYKAIESIKNKKISVKKYDSAKFRFDSNPHVVVFANKRPRQYFESKGTRIKGDHNGVPVYEKFKEWKPTLSNDRWDIRTIKREISDNKMKFKVIKEPNPNRLIKEEIPEGFIIPGTVIPVAEPDEILSDNEDDNVEEVEIEKEEVKENVDDWEVESTTGFSSVSRAKPITPVKKESPKRYFKSPPRPPNAKNIFVKS